MTGAPEPETRVLVVGDREAALTDLLADALRGHVDAELAATADDDLEGVWASHGPFHLVVAGPECVTAEGLARLAHLRATHPRAAVIVVTDGPLPPELASALVRVGAADLLEQPVAAMELRAAVLRSLRLAAQQAPEREVAPGRTADHPPGRVIAVASAAGGSGKTFVATNLAWLLRHHGDQRVALVDLDLQFGAITTAWHLSARHTILDVAGDDVDADPDVLAGSLDEMLVTHVTGVAVLAAPPDPADADRVAPRHVAAVLDALRRRYDTVVVDTATGLSDHALTTFDVADRVYVVSALDLPALRNTKGYLQTLARLRLTDDDVVLVLNKADEAAGLQPDKVERLFPRPFDARIPYDGQVLRSFTDGAPLLACAPRADAAHELTRVLANELSDERRALLAPPPDARWWRRLLPGDPLRRGSVMPLAETG